MLGVAHDVLGVGVEFGARKDNAAFRRPVGDVCFGHGFVVGEGCVVGAVGESMGLVC